MPRLAVAWRITLVGVTAPLLVGGFLASALANRIVFAGWALAAAAAALLVLRSSFELAWHPGRPGESAARIGAAACGVLAPAAVLFGLLVARHREDLDLGLRAVWPALHTPAAAAPGSYFAAAAVLALAGGAAALRAAALRRRRTGGATIGGSHG